MNAGPPLALKPDGWLGGFLGKPVWHLTSGAVTDGPVPLPEDERCFVDAKLGVGDIQGVALLQASGFRLVDTTIQLDRPVAHGRTTAGVRPAEPKDRQTVERLAEQSFTFSRFHQDPDIPRSVADRIKRAWVGNYFEGKRGQHLLVAEVAGEIAGFLQLLQQDSLLTIDLIAVDARHRGKGLAGRMIGGAEAMLPEIEHLRVGTQAANTRSLRSYIADGFSFFSAQHVLHFHR